MVKMPNRMPRIHFVREIYLFLQVRIDFWKTAMIPLLNGCMACRTGQQCKGSDVVPQLALHWVEF